MTTPLTITVDRHDDGTLALVAAGEIDLSNVHTFANSLDDAVAENTGQTVIVDLSAIDYLDSGAIDALFTQSDHIRIITNPLLLSVLTISGLTEVTTVEPG